MVAQPAIRLRVERSVPRRLSFLATLDNPTRRGRALRFGRRADADGVVRAAFSADPVSF